MAGNAISRYMSLVLLIAAATKAATPEQREEIREATQLLRQPAGPGTGSGDIAQLVLDIMGPEWAPDDETMAYIQAIRGETQ